MIKGKKVFVVEDESLVAMQLEDMLSDLGCDVVGLAMKVNRALEMLDTDIEVELAILDVNIGGEKVYPIAEHLRGRNIPMIFATGYGREGVEPDWQDYPILQKPYTAEQVERSISTAMAA